MDPPLPHADPTPEDTTTPTILPFSDDDEEEDIECSISPTLPDTTLPPQPQCCSSHVPILTECNPIGGPRSTCTEMVVQEARESATHVKEARRACKVTKQNAVAQGNNPNTPNIGNDAINDLQQVFENLDLGDQAHELLALISEMSTLDPESLQFKDEPQTWDEAKNSVDTA